MEHDSPLKTEKNLIVWKLIKDEQISIFFVIIASKSQLYGACKLQEPLLHRSLLKLRNIRGRDIFTKGSQVLPLEPLAGKHGRNKAGFLDKGESLGGELVNPGDAALRFFPGRRSRSSSRSGWKTRSFRPARTCSSTPPATSWSRWTSSDPQRRWACGRCCDHCFLDKPATIC